MRIRSALVVVFVAVACSASAQPIPIHPSCPAPLHGQVYNSPQEWVWGDSDMWANVLVDGVSAINGMTDLDTPGHAHIRYGMPECGMVAGGQLTIPVALFDFHTNGFIGGSDALVSFIPGTVVSYQTMGDAEFRTKYGHTVAAWPHATTDAFPLTSSPSTLDIIYLDVTLDLSAFAPTHGWYAVQLCTTPHYTTPAAGGGSVCGQLPFYSVIDPSRPEGEGAALPLSGPMHGTVATYGTPIVAPFRFGTYQAIEFGGFDPNGPHTTAMFIPIDAVSADHPLTLTAAGYDYPDVSSGPVSGFTDIRLGANFHVGNSGTVLASTPVAPSETVASAVFPTASTPLGETTIIYRWVTSSPDGKARLTTNFSMPVTVVASGSIPSPPLPPPPPPPSLPVFTTVIPQCVQGAAPENCRLVFPDGTALVLTVP